MRILLVSAHYPPNFVSGGTLGPQRLARGLRDRGHDVSVYAGWIGERPPLETWSDVDETGMDVRWIVTTPWTAWWDRRNYDNPDVTTDFRLHLDEVRPDVVHAHSLQSLGLGIVEACVDAGVRIVVTMHDFWWICGRQFLSNRATELCSAVVSCGMCHCEVDRDWLDERNDRLRETLARVDLVLAVSESQAELLRANGIGVRHDGPVVVVDENGLPPLPGRGRRRLTEPEVTFLYTGGGERLKGVDVVLEAARQLAGTSGWRIEAYGVGEYLRVFDVDPPQGVRVHPRFAPEEADAVFEGADVLLLPSVVRESHSLVTREALSRGMPVITSDTVGPEEVVRHGENGLVLPAGDGGALAKAMAAVVRDPGLREALARGAEQPVTLRTIDAQLEGLDGLLREVVARRPTPRRVPPRQVRRVLFLVGIEGAPLRYRARFAAEALELEGVTSWVRHYRSAEAVALAALADAVVVYRVPATDQVLALIAATRGRGVPVFFDVDDLIFDPEVAASIPSVQALEPAERALYLQGVRRYRTTLEACDAYIGSTQLLVDHVRDRVGIEAHRWRNGVGMGPARCADIALAHPRTPGPCRIGYLSGTKTHDEDWRFVEPAVVDVLRRRPDVELWLGGFVEPSPALDPHRARIRRLEFKPWWELPWVLRDLDVNLAPLAPGGVFNEAKSSIKWLEAALAEVPTVASATGPFRESIDDGVTGRLAVRAEDFASAIDGLLDDELGRIRMGRLARRRALIDLSPHVQGRRYLDILEGGALGRVAPTSWTTPEALDEPWADVPLEDYVVPDPMVLAPLDPMSPRSAPPQPAPPRRGTRLRAAVSRITAPVR